MLDNPMHPHLTTNDIEDLLDHQEVPCDSAPHPHFRVVPHCSRRRSDEIALSVVYLPGVFGSGPSVRGQGLCLIVGVQLKQKTTLRGSEENEERSVVRSGQFHEETRVTVGPPDIRAVSDQRLEGRNPDRNRQKLCQDPRHGRALIGPP